MEARYVSWEPEERVVVVYRAGLPTDAWLCQHWLRRNGVAAEVRADLMSGRGELPIAESAPSVWVPDADVDLALVLVAQFERPHDGPAWTCASCHEENPGNFDGCWSCGAARA